MSFAYNWSLGTTLLRRKMSSSMRIAAGILMATLIAIAAICAYLQAKNKTTEHAAYITLSFFMAPDHEYSDVENIAKDIKLLSSAVRDVHISTPDSVRIHFNNQVRIDISEVLPSNPFPYHITVYFHPAETSLATITALSDELRRMDGIEGVTYNSSYARAVFSEMDTLQLIAILVGVLVCILIATLLYFSLRSEPALSMDDVRVLNLLGAPNSVARTSSVTRIMIAALVGVILAAAIALGILAYTDQIHLTALWSVAWFPIVLGAGTVLLLSFLFALRSVPKPHRNVAYKR